LRFKHHYSGGVSAKFWRRVSRIRNYRVAYSLACALQEVEAAVLKTLKHLEESGRKR
jgi:hypothetical protein